MVNVVVSTVVSTCLHGGRSGNALTEEELRAAEAKKKARKDMYAHMFDQLAAEEAVARREHESSQSLPSLAGWWCRCGSLWCFP